jgi:KipI family sensor histidine kinase inhibitor
MRWRWVGDRALLRTFEEASVPDANRTAVACARSLVALGATEVEDVVPGARSVLVVLRPGVTPPRAVTALLDGDAWTSEAGLAGRSIDIPVRYGGADGPDLADVARIAGITEEDVVSVHSAAGYVVGFVGFSPGFAYLLGLDDRIAVPRLETPRARVAPGSVGIGGSYTGVYPRATAGGWRLIGRSDVELFDPNREPPSLLGPGDRVRFLPR